MSSGRTSTFSVTWADEDWLNEHIEEKFEKYLRARKALPEHYAEASIDRNREGENGPWEGLDAYMRAMHEG